MLIAVDPGKHACGVAEFERSLLVRASMRVEPLGGFRDVRCVCEKPNRRGPKSKVKMSDLVDLALAAGRMTGQLPTKYVTSAQWKGNVPKAIQHARMMSVLTEEEKKVLAAVDCKKSLLHNAYDAVCLGLVELGRM